MSEYPYITIYTSVNSGGYDVQIWRRNYKPSEYDPASVTRLSSNRFSSREAGHAWADRWLDDSKFKDIRREHKL